MSNIAIFSVYPVEDSVSTKRQIIVDELGIAYWTSGKNQVHRADLLNAQMAARPLCYCVFGLAQGYVSEKRVGTMKREWDIIWQTDTIIV